MRTCFLYFRISCLQSRCPLSGTIRLLSFSGTFFSYSRTYISLCHVRFAFSLCHVRGCFSLCHVRAAFSLCHVRAAFSLCHVRACPGHRPHGFPDQAHTLSLSLPDLIRHSSVEQGIHRHKAWPHDMHAESIARQQRFVPQPIMRSSRQQLVIFARGLLKNRQKINCGHPC